MQPFNTFTGIVAPIDRPNVDTDSIIPKQYLKSIKRTGFGPNLFDDWRYLDPGNPGDNHNNRRINPDFVLNQDRYKDADILLARENFGCGSSREHAVWSLMEYGFRAIIAPSFAEIFYSNSFKNGFLPIVLDTKIIDQLFHETFSTEGYALMVDLENLIVITPDKNEIIFKVNANLQNMLLKGQDEIDNTLTYADDIRVFEQRRKQITPWLFQEGE